MNGLTQFIDHLDRIIDNMNLWQVICVIIVAFLVGVGCYNIITEYLIFPSEKSRKVVLNYGKGMKKNGSEIITISMATAISKYIHLDEGRRITLQKNLIAAGMNCTPEFYTAKALANAIIIFFMGVIIALMLSAIVSWVLIMAIILVLTVYAYYISIAEVNEIIERKSKEIEPELALFASTIQKQLSSTTDIIKIFESYRKICGETFRREIDITIADMKTGSYEPALLNLDNRVRSDALSQIIRGLISVLKGDDQRFYFEMLVYDLANAEQERLKRIALKRPQQLNSASNIVLCCFCGIIVYLIVYQVYTEVTAIL